MPGKLLFVLVSWILMLGNTNALLVVTYPGPDGQVIASLDPETGTMETLLTVDPMYRETSFRVSPTGDRLAYVAWPGREGNNATPTFYYIVTLPDGEPQLVADNGQTIGTNSWFPVAPVWSPDGTKIAIYTDEGLTIVNAIDGSSFDLAPSYRGEYSVQWSPDSRRIVFNDLIGHGNPGAAVVVDVEQGAEARPLLEGGPDVHDGALMWLADSEHILFQRSEGYSGDNTQFFQVNLETMQPTELDLSQFYEPRFLGVLNDTTVILSTQTGEGYSLVRYDLISGQQTPTAVLDSAPRFCSCVLSPDGAYYGISGLTRGLQVFDLMNGQLVVEIPLIESIGYSLAWSPDSTYLVYRYGDSNPGLFRVNADGSGGVQQLTDLRVEVIGWIER